MRIRAGYAACLHESLASTGASLMPPEDASGDVGPSGDERGDLVLQLLLHTLDQPAPNFAHLLMGYNVEDGVQGMLGAASKGLMMNTRFSSQKLQ